MNQAKLTKAVLFGVAVGDALGVPVEFKSREMLAFEPVTDMTGYGTYNQPPGTWSDDASLTFCLAEALTHGYDIAAIGKNFVKWFQDNFWTPHGEVFDIGIATRRAIDRIASGIKGDLAGGTDEYSNGNGSLMRILPLLFYLQDKPIEERFRITGEVSSITHGHIRSVIACFYYLEFAIQLTQMRDKFDIYNSLKTEIGDFLSNFNINPDEISFYDRLLTDDIYKLPEEAIQSSGYLVHTLEASIWCLLTTSSYRSAVLKAINLGEDTDTAGAVTGGLAGLLYGYDKIPSKWIAGIARTGDIDKLAERLGAFHL